jgi:hypothetical protein
MPENDEFGHYVPLLRRIIILAAVITAVPVMLWTITAFVRTYVGPPKIPTFHQLAATASINAPVPMTKPDAYKQQQPAAQQAKTDPSSTRVEARATATDSRDLSLGPKGPLLGDHAPEGDAAAPAAITTKMADTSMAVPGGLKASDMTISPPAATDGAVSTTGALTAQQQPAAMAPSTDSLAAAAPLRGPIPLPRRRPRDIGAVHMADIAPGNVPVPRPRPDGAGPASPAETSSGSPIDFIQNLFH